MAERFVIDSSVVISWCFEDESDPYADSVLDELAAASALVPAIWPVEVANVLLVAERWNRLSQAESSRFLQLLSQLPIVVDDERVERKMSKLLSLGRANQLSSYDAAYLELAMREGIPIATLDRNLRAAAEHTSVQILL